MVRTDAVVVGMLALLGTAVMMTACSSTGGTASGTTSSVAGTDAACNDGVRDGSETGIDCGGSCVACSAQGTKPNAEGGPGGPDSTGPGMPAGGIDGVKDGSETDVDCGGPDAPKCAEGMGCLVDSDCDVACSYAKKCVIDPELHDAPRRRHLRHRRSGPARRDARELLPNAAWSPDIPIPPTLERRSTSTSTRSPRVAFAPSSSGSRARTAAIPT